NSNPEGSFGKPRTVSYPTDRIAFLADGRVVPHDTAMVSRDGSRFLFVGRTEFLRNVMLTPDSRDGSRILSVAEGVQVWDSPHELARAENDLLGLSGRGIEEPLCNGCRFSADRRRVWTFGRGPWAQAHDTVTGRPVGVPLQDSSAGRRSLVTVSRDG